jgi:hypothetical protein
MKVEIEIDENRVFEEVVKRLYDHMRYSLEQKFDQAIKGEIVTALLIEVRALTKAKIPFITLSDGQTIEQYIDNLLFKRTMESGDWKKRSRIQQIVDEQIYQHAQQIFRDMCEPHIKRLKEGVLKGVVEEILHKLGSAA